VIVIALFEHPLAGWLTSAVDCCADRIVITVALSRLSAGLHRKAHGREPHMNRVATLCLALLAMLTLSALPSVALASATLLTISCEKPWGTSTVYGVTLGDLTESVFAHQPTPDAKLYPPRADGFSNTVITIHSDGSAAVTIDYPQKLGGVETHDMLAARWDQRVRYFAIGSQ
jgi:hypothetical protein